MAFKGLTANLNASKRLWPQVIIFSSLIPKQAKRIASIIEEGCIIAVLADAGWKYLSMDLWATT